MLGNTVWMAGITSWSVADDILSFFYGLQIFFGLHPYFRLQQRMQQVASTSLGPKVDHTIVGTPTCR
jgi:hypothetical protein